MKMKAIYHIKKQPDIKKVHLLNQDYAQWQNVGALWAAEMVGMARPDIQVCGRGAAPHRPGEGPKGNAGPSPRSGARPDWGWDAGANHSDSRKLSRSSQECAEKGGTWGRERGRLGDHRQQGPTLLLCRGRATENLRYFQPQRGLHPGTVLAVSQAKAGPADLGGRMARARPIRRKVDALAKAYQAKTGKGLPRAAHRDDAAFLAAAIGRPKSPDPVKVAARWKT